MRRRRNTTEEVLIQCQVFLDFSLYCNDEYCNEKFRTRASGASRPLSLCWTVVLSNSSDGHELTVFTLMWQDDHLL